MGVNHGVRVLQLRDGMNCGCCEVPGNATMFTIAFTSKSLSSAEWHYSNIEQEALGILNRLEKFHHFAEGAYIITNHKPLVAIISKDVASLSQ